MNLDSGGVCVTVYKPCPLRIFSHLRIMDRENILWKYFVSIYDTYSRWQVIVTQMLKDGILNEGRKLVLRQYTEDVIRNIPNKTEAMKILYHYMTYYTGMSLPLPRMEKGI